MAKINFKAIYKCTTIDPPGTIKHCMENSVQIVRPQQTFFQLVAKNGMPNRFMRYVLLQFLNWFKTDFKELPLFAKDPFTDNACNCFARLITDYKCLHCIMTEYE